MQPVTHLSKASAFLTEDARGLPDRMIVRPWFDPGLALSGIDPRSDYVERFFSCLVGPSVVLLTRRFARGLTEHPGGYSISTADTARAIGLGAALGPNAPMARTLDRAAMFGFLRLSEPGSIEVRTHLPMLTQRQLRRLPRSVLASHDHWISTQRTEPSPAA